MFAVIKDKPGPGVGHCYEPQIPAPGPGEVLLKVRKAAICGTDFHIFKWDSWSEDRVSLPQTIGHEFVGDIADLGIGVSHLDVGQRVSVESHTVCGHCLQCRVGQGHLCANTIIIGVDRPGAFAEYICVPAFNVWPVPEKIPDRDAALFDPAGNAMHTLQPLEVAGRNVLITGAGGIGLFAVVMARWMGARTVGVIETEAYRRDLASQLGADYCLAPSDQTRQSILGKTDGIGPDVVAEMSGAPSALSLALDVLRTGGSISLLGLFTDEVRLNLTGILISKGITVYGISGRRLFDTWRLVEGFMLNNQSAMSRIATHEIPYTAYQEGFDLMASGQCGRVVLTFDDVGKTR